MNCYLARSANSVRKKISVVKKSGARKLKLDSAYVDTSMYDEPEDRGVIEVPVDAETVVYIDDEGQAYEISIDELIDADTDNEISYVPDNEPDDDNSSDDDFDLKSSNTARKRRLVQERRMTYQRYLSLSRNSSMARYHGRVR